MNKEEEKPQDLKRGKTGFIDVGCAVISKGGKILIARRPYGSFLSGYWEFPGGKRLPEEDIEACLVREVREELGIEIAPFEFFRRVDHVYPEKRVSLYFYFCDWVSGTPTRRHCLDFAWVEPAALRRYRFVPADQDIINELVSKRAWYFGPYRRIRRRCGL